MHLDLDTMWFVLSARMNDINLAGDEVEAIKTEFSDVRIQALCDDWFEFAKRLESVGAAASMINDVAELRRRDLLEILEILSSDQDLAKVGKRAKEKIEALFSPSPFLAENGD